MNDETKDNYGLTLKRTLKEVRNPRTFAKTDAVQEQAEPKSKRAKRPLSEKQLEQRRNAAKSRTMKQTIQKQKQLLEQEVPQVTERKDGLPDTPAADELPFQSGKLNRPDIPLLPQTLAEDEFMKRVRNRWVRDVGYTAPSLESFQRRDANYLGSAHIPRLEQGVLMNPSISGLIQSPSKGYYFQK